VKLLQSGLPEGSGAILGAAALAWHEVDKHHKNGLMEVSLKVRGESMRVNAEFDRVENEPRK